MRQTTVAPHMKGSLANGEMFVLVMETTYERMVEYVPRRTRLTRVQKVPDKPQR